MNTALHACAPNRSPANWPRVCKTAKLIAVAGGLLFATWGVVHAQEFNFTMAAIPVPGDAYDTLTASVPERIAKATGGRVKVTINHSLIPGPQITSAVREGRVEMSGAIHTYLAAEEPRLGIFNLPGLIESIAEYKKVGEAFWFEDARKVWKERYNAVVLAEGAWCNTRLFSKVPIKTVEDFKNKRLRVHNPQTAQVMNAIGAKPVPLPVPEIMPSLERGVIDGVFTSSCVGSGQDYHRVAKHVLDWRIGPITGWAVIINADTWAKLPADLQGKISAAMKDLQKESLDNYDSYTNAALNHMKANGATLWTVPSKEGQRLNDPKFVRPSYDAWHARAKEVGFDGEAYVKRIKGITGRP